VATANEVASKELRFSKAQIQVLLMGACLANCIWASWDQLDRLLAHIASQKGPPGHKTSDEDVKWLIARISKITHGVLHSWQDWNVEGKVRALYRFWRRCGGGTLETYP